VDAASASFSHFRGLLIVKIPKGFFPQEDTGSLSGAVQERYLC
jgi:hypothetical protein